MESEIFSLIATQNLNDAIETTELLNKNGIPAQLDSIELNSNYSNHDVFHYVNIPLSYKDKAEILLNEKIESENFKNPEERNKGAKTGIYNLIYGILIIAVSLPLGFINMNGTSTPYPTPTKIQILLLAIGVPFITRGIIQIRRDKKNKLQDKV